MASKSWLKWKALHNSIFESHVQEDTLSCPKTKDKKSHNESQLHPEAKSLVIILPYKVSFGLIILSFTLLYCLIRYSIYASTTRITYAIA